MSIAEITRAAVEKIRDRRFDFVFVNYPNVDVVGHIENEAAVISAVEVVDRNMGVVVDEALLNDMAVVITADHGTVEKWLYPDGAVDTGHTDSPVPFILVDPSTGISLKKQGELADVAPTVLQLFGVDVPDAMEGRSLIEGTYKIAANPRVLFLLLDGWGYNASGDGNLISKARTPHMDRFMKEYPFSILKAAGVAVGLPEGTVGNSEVGHLHIGSGRRIYSDRVRIERAIADGSFFANPAFTGPMRKARETGTAVHLMGIVSFFSSHGSVNHLLALMELARKEGIRELYIHAMLGRRGEMPESGANYIRMIEEKTGELGVGRVVSVIGRYWSMDREENWDRIEKTYSMLVSGLGLPVPDC